MNQMLFLSFLMMILYTKDIYHFAFLPTSREIVDG